MAFDLFSLADEAPQKTPEKSGGVSAHIPGFESMKPKTQQALATVVQVVAEAASAGKLPGQPNATSNHVLAFVAACKSAGLTDPALKPVTVSGIGRCDYDVVELSRLANELLRGVRSDRPELTPARWKEAGEIARQRGARP